MFILVTILVYVPNSPVAMNIINYVPNLTGGVEMYQGSKIFSLTSKAYYITKFSKENGNSNQYMYDFILINRCVANY